MKKVFAILTALLLMAAILPQMAMAQVTVDVSLGQVAVGDTHVTHVDGEGKEVNTVHHGSVTVIQSNPQTGGSILVHAAKPVQITLSQVVNGKLTLSDADITVEENAAIAVTKGSSIAIELDGISKLTGGEDHAALQVDPDSSITILDENREEGTLVALGGSYGAGIGGGYKSDSGAITIAGGNIMATAGGRSAGIGGGRRGSGADIIITGGKVVALGDNHGAGIGGGEEGSGSNILITGGIVEALGGEDGAGIGGGDGGSGTNITILGGTVNAASASSGAGIGGGFKGDGKDIVIDGGLVKASGGNMGAGIGGGWNGKGINLTVSGDAAVTAAGKNNGANIGNGAEYNGSQQPDNVDVTRLNAFGSYNAIPGTAEVADSIPLASAPETEPKE